MKKEYNRKRKAVVEEIEEGEGREGTAGGDEQASISGSCSTGDRLRGELRSKRREDVVGRRRAGCVEVGKGKGVEGDVRMAEYIVRHRCAFESICALVEDLSDAQREAVRTTVWGPVLEYNKFVMDRYLVQALIHAWNPDSLEFMIGGRGVQFSYFDVALLTGLPATGREVVFGRSDSVGEVEQVVMEAMEARLERERQRRRGDRKDSRIYRNYVAVMIELCRQHNTLDRLPMFRKLFSLLVLSGLFFPRSAGGVAWELIDLVDDVDRLAEYNWAAAIWKFLVDALGETKEKMHTTKNVQISGFAMVIQVWK